MSGSGSTASGCRAAERGSATIWTVAGIAAVSVVAVAILMVGAATVARHRVESAADLAALAAAAYAPSGRQFACGRARWVAERMHTTLRSCQLVGWDAFVQTTTKISGLPGGDRTTTGRARAGPVIG